MVKKYKCLGCGEYKNDEPYKLCEECQKDEERQINEFEKEYGEPKEIEETEEEKKE